MKPLHPFWCLAAAAVRGKHCAVGGIQITVNGLKNRLRASLVGISQCAAPNFESYAEVRQLVRLGKQRRCYLSQRVKPHYHRIQHHNEMYPAIKALGIAFSTIFVAEMKNFGLVKQFYYLTIERLSAKMITFAHGYLSFSQKQSNHKGRTPANGTRPNFFRPSKNFYRTAIISK